MRVCLSCPGEHWTVEDLRAALSSLPGETRVQVFVPFDGEGPNDWASPHIVLRDGVLRIAPYEGASCRGSK